MELAAQDKLNSTELSQFFLISAELHRTSRKNDRTSDEKILALLDEIEGIALHTVQEPLRLRCEALLRQYTEPANCVKPAAIEADVCQLKSS